MTKSSLYKLRAEAVMAGNDHAVALCDRALASDCVAIAECRAWREIADPALTGVVASIDDDDDTATVSLDDGSLSTWPVSELEGAVVSDRVKVGDRVQTANLTPDDSDRGRVTDIDGDMATVAWDTQVVTPCPLSDLEVES